MAVRALLELSDEDTLDCIVEGGQDFGVDAIFAGPVQDDEFRVTLIQGKYKKDLAGESGFPESGIKDMILAVSTLFDPGKAVTVNSRLKSKLEDIRSLVADGAIPTIHAILCNNGKRWNEVAQEHITRSGLGDQVSWQHILTIHQFSRHSQSFGRGRAWSMSLAALRSPRVNQESLLLASFLG